ncbi:gamma-glutamyltransferase [Natronolimnohabitans sp. A-GB9]|uniref:gamma-glutamyltransferase n=1 Tax=Natronolimnohabitans sp. A-GB9 TaxID=3069757 RepID=UPI0027AEB2F9|nr:gamma-glutamyltransferase [Natronolimnohabitans sp. A-GB9]MDQ2050137.1 gamma-glutamyltransferase [Natronolimnohabitans sp. A-GB9]
MGRKYNPSKEKRDGSDATRSDLNRRRFLALTGASASALAIGSTPAVAGPEYQDVTDVSGFSCDHPQFTCGRQVRAADGMISTVDPIAGGVAARVLREGGNAIDAAIAIQYVLTVTQPHGSGIGGGGFMVIYDAESDSVEVVNSRERASQTATPDLYRHEGEYDQDIQTGEAMGTPGTVAGLETARELFGTRSRQRLINPAIDLARRGFTVDWFLAEQIHENTNKFNDAALGAYSDAQGNLYEEGDTMTNPDLADTLEIIRREGAEGFYEGPVAEDVAETIASYARDPDQVVDERDLADYDVTLDEPVRKEWYDVELVGQPMPSSGPTVAAMVLRVLEFLDVDEYDVRSAEKYHLIAESLYSCWADRMEYMGDDEFVDVPVDELLSDDYLQSRADEIEFGDTVFPDDGTMPPGDPTPDGRGAGETTHFSVIDKWGNAVSYTSTIEQFMGSGKMVPGRGFLLNNELTDFDAEPGGPNEPDAWKRPLSSMSPMMVMRDGTPEFTAGSPGGWAIVSATFQTILHRYVYDLDPLGSITEPQVYTHHFGGVEWEEGVPTETRETLADWGHDLDESPSTIGNVQAIGVEDDELVGAADPSRDGQAVGYDRGGLDRARGAGQGRGRSD